MKPQFSVSNSKTLRLVALLTDWFSRNARDLPWRRTQDPYAIWVSEIMLQQTQVKTVIPFFERWMRALPTIQSLAGANPDTIHKLWEGLGYYTRVRNMQKAAQQVVANHDGRVPANYDEVLALPGIGRYTAGAICSIAFNQPRPILDGNVVRVLTRLFGISGNPREKDCNERLWDLARTLVEGAASGSGQAQRRSCAILNESLMELGALICTPREPRCRACPLARHCVAKRQQRVIEFPKRADKAPATRRHYAAFVLKRGARVLVRQRNAGVVNAHLWEFPNIELPNAGADPARAAQILFGATKTALEPLATIRHSITRYRITLNVYNLQFPDRDATPRVSGQWMHLSHALDLSFPSAHRRILNHLAAGVV